MSCSKYPVLRLMYRLRNLIKERVSTLVQSQDGINLNRSNVSFKIPVLRLIHCLRNCMKLRLSTVV